jgi:hypothetical protein
VLSFGLDSEDPNAVDMDTDIYIASLFGTAYWHIRARMCLRHTASYYLDSYLRRSDSTKYF